MRLQIFLYLALAILPCQTNYKSDLEKYCVNESRSKDSFIAWLDKRVTSVENETKKNMVLRINHDREERIVKVLFSKKINPVSFIENEINTLENLSQYWFVNTLNEKDENFCFYDEHNTYIMMKAFDSSLDNIHKHYDLEEIYHNPSWQLFAILAVGNAMVRLHNLRYLHRDIKPQNVFVKDVFDIVLGDFDLTIFLPPKTGEEIVKGHKTSDSAGTRVYSAPEVIKSQTYSVKSDAFSFGVFIFKLLTNETFSEDHMEHENLMVLISKYRNCSKKYDTGTTTDLYCNYFKPLVEKLISKSPNNRPYAYALIKQLYEIAFKAYTSIKT